MGTPPFAATCLERLLATRHIIAVVVTRPDKPRGRGMEAQPSAVKQLADARALEVLAPAGPKDPAFLARLRALDADLGVVVAYGRILPDAVLESPRLGCINAHASLLPALRGAAPIERAILEGHERTGVSIMRINERLDAGDVMLTGETAIDDAIDGATLRERLALQAADLLAQAVDLLADGAARFTPQNEGAATYAPPLRREESCIDWNEPALEVGRRVRAFAPRPGAFTFDGGKRIKILRGRALRDQQPPPGASTRVTAPAGTVLAVDGDSLVVRCGGGEYLVDVVQPEGKREMTAGAWARGQGGSAGARGVIGRRFDRHQRRDAG
jgi:methionyl-tRNA formyltransferase